MPEPDAEPEASTLISLPTRQGHADLYAKRFIARGALLLVLFVLWLVSPATGSTLLPLESETVTTLPSGTLETILGASYFKDMRFPAFTPPGVIQSQDLVAGPEVGLRVGVGSRVEIQAAFEFLYLNEKTGGESNSVYGNGDARLATKVRILSEKQWWPALGIRFGTKLPNANKADRLGTDEVDFAIETLASKDFGILATHVNMGIAILGNPGPVVGAEERDSSGQDDLFSYAVAVVSRDFRPAILGKWGIRALAEVGGVTGSRFDNDRAAVAGGFQLQRGNLTLYTGVSAGLVTASQNFGLRGGLIYAFDLARLGDLAD